MAPFNPYVPNYSYNPYLSQYQAMQPQPQVQPQMMQQQPVQAIQPPAPQQPQQSTIIWVNGEKEAAMFPIATNTAVALWDTTSPIVYLKQADASGKPSIRTFDLIERVEQVQGNANAGNVDLSSFAVKSDVAALAGVVSNMTKDIDAVKEELANLAASAVKRAVGVKPKKVEIEEGDE